LIRAAEIDYPDIFITERLLEHRIKIILTDVALEGSTGFGLGTLRFKWASVADVRRSNILIRY